MTSGGVLVATGSERLAQRERVVVIVGMALVVALGWIYLLSGAGMDMGSMDGMGMGPGDGAPSAGVLIAAAMWAAMMPAMMLPSAAPMILMYGAIARRTREQGSLATTGVFLAGYLAVWTAFACGAALVQVVLANASLLSGASQRASSMLGGMILIASGLYQLTPPKHACLSRCRSPVQFLTSNWRPGGAGAFRMGVVHGTFCLGCCWVLMVLLFAGGVMNLAWVALIALVVLAEKVLPAGGWVARVGGVGFAISGAVLIVTG